MEPASISVSDSVCTLSANDDKHRGMVSHQKYARPCIVESRIRHVSADGGLFGLYLEGDKNTVRLYIAYNLASRANGVQTVSDSFGRDTDFHRWTLTWSPSAARLSKDLSETREVTTNIPVVDMRLYFATSVPSTMEIDLVAVRPRLQRHPARRPRLQRRTGNRRPAAALPRVLQRPDRPRRGRPVRRHQRQRPVGLPGHHPVLPTPHMVRSKPAGEPVRLEQQRQM